MPLFQSARTGEGVFVERAASQRRDKLDANHDRFMTYRMWARQVDEGISLRRLARMVGKPLRTIRDGIAAYRAAVALVAADADPDEVIARF